MLKIIYSFLLFFYALDLSAQVEVELANNDMKYWKLRGRLTGDYMNRGIYNGFLSVGADAGQSIPSEKRIAQKNSWLWYFSKDNDPGEAVVPGPCNLQYNYTIDPTQNDPINGYPKIDSRDNQPYTGVVDWGGDATIQLGNYLGILATEWELLNRSGASTYATEEELYYALKAIERLDYYAENLYGISPALNGFLARDDVPDNFAINKMGENFDLVISEASCFKHIDNPTNSQKEANDCDDKLYNISKLRKNVMSQDQVIGLLTGMALVKKFIPTWVTFNNFNLRNMNKYSAILIMDYVQKSQNTNYWFITDPDTKKVVCRGAAAGIFSYPLAKLGKYITGNNYQNMPSLTLGRDFWWLMVMYYKANPAGNIGFSFIDFPTGPATILGVPISFTIFDPKPYTETLMLKLAALTGAASNQGALDYKGKKFIRDVSFVNKKEIYDLLGSVMCGYEPYKSSTWWREQFNQQNCGCNCFQINNPSGFLDCENYINNIAATYGPWNVINRWDNLTNNDINDAVNDPSSNPPIPTDNIYSVYEYSGMDYMLAYNLYRIKFFGYGYKSKIRKNISNATFPYYFTPPGNSYLVGGQQYPLEHKAVFSIESSNTILNQDAKVYYFAGSEIKLKPGFHAKPGSFFYANIRKYDCYANQIGQYALYKAEDSLTQLTMFEENDTTVNIWNDSTDIDFTDTTSNDSLCFTYYIVDDTLFAVANPDCIFTDSGGIYYVPPANKAMPNETTLHHITFFPNPTNTEGYLEYILYMNSQVKIMVTNELGQVMQNVVPQEVYSQSRGKQKVTLYTANLSPGIYFCVVELNGRRQVLKFTVLH